MKRIIAVAILVSFAAVPVAQAEERRFTPNMSVSFSPAPTPTVVVAPRLTSKASIDKSIAAVASHGPTTVLRRRSVLKKAWFWVVVGGAAAALIIIAANSGDGGGGGIY